MKFAARSLLVAWIFLTLTYLLLMGTGLHENGILGRITFFIGLFVPYGFFNGSLALTGGLTSGSDNGFFLRFTLLLVVGFIVFFDLVTKKLFSNKSTRVKIALNLVILFILTIMVDYATWHMWPSLGLFLDGELFKGL